MAAYLWNQAHPSELVKNPIVLLQDSLTLPEKNALDVASVQSAFERLYAAEAELRTISELN